MILYIYLSFFSTKMARPVPVWLYSHTHREKERNAEKKRKKTITHFPSVSALSSPASRVRLGASRWGMSSTPLTTAVH